jgi:hypothetical protein
MVRTRRSILAIAVVALTIGCGGASPVAHSEPAPVRKAPAPQPRVEAPAEPLPPLQILFGLKGTDPRLRECLLVNAQTPGFARIRWVVEPEGVVHGPQIEQATVEDPVATCLVESLAELKFQPIERPSVARWTFVRSLDRSAVPETATRDKKKRRNEKKRKDRDHDSVREPGLAIAPSSPGWLPPERIENVVQAGYGLFAHCYRAGLDRDASLGGAVRLKFVIDERGAVARVVDGGSDLPDARVIGCMAEGLYALEFPRPARGRVHVFYNVVFDSG